MTDMDDELDEAMNQEIAALKSQEEAERLAALDEESEEEEEEEHDILEERALMCLEGTNPLRVFCHTVINKWWFSTIILIAIIVNCFFIAAEDPENLVLTSAAEVAEWVFMVVFTVEAILKITALGFIGHRGAYLRDGWNVLDFFLVVMSFVQLLPGVANLTPLRVIRVLRALRSINKVKGMKIIINSLLGSLRGLWEVMMLLTFGFIIFGLLAVQLWSGKMHHRCYEPLFNGTGDGATDLAPIGYQITLDELGEDKMCGNDTSMARICPEGTICLAAAPGPLHNFMQFDHLGWSLLTLFIAMTGDGWTAIQYWTQQNFSYLTWAFWIFFMIAMNFIGVNMVLAVIIEKFSEAKDAALEAGKKRVRVLSAGHDPGGDPDALPLSSFTKRLGSRWDEFAGKERRLPQNSVSKAVLNFITYTVKGVTIFDTVIMIAIIINTIFLCLEYPGMDEGMKEFLEGANIFFTFLFLMEMVLKLIALGGFMYFREPMNVFDAVVVVASITEMILAWANPEAEGSSLAIVFRVLRCVRIFKLARKWKAMRKVVQQVAGNLAQITYLVLIIVLFVFIYAVVGRQLFKDQFSDEVKFADNQVDRAHFDTLGDSMLTTFQVLTGDAWSLVLFNMMRTDQWIGGMIWSITWVIFGNFILLNLFVAILLEGLGGDEEEEDSDGGDGADDVDGDSRPEKSMGASVERMEVEGGPSRPSAVTRCCMWWWEVEKTRREKKEEEEKKIVLQAMLSARQARVSQADRPGDANSKGVGKAMVAGATKTAGKGFAMVQQVTSKGIKLAVKKEGTIADRRVQRRQGNSLGIFGPENPVRIWCWKICNSMIFEWFMITVILLSCLTLALDHPHLDPNDSSDASLKSAILVLDIIFTIVFVIEAAMKAIAYGAMRNSDAYLRDGWDQLDFLVVFVTLLTIPFDIAAVRAVRAIRPLRILGRFENTRVVIAALIQSVKASINVLMVTSIFWIVFGILGVQIFGGKMGKCDADMLPTEPMTEEVCTSTMYDYDESEQIMLAPYVYTPPTETRLGEWSTPPWNFDDFGRSLLTLFQVCLMAGWTDVMADAVDVTGVGLQPQEEASKGLSLFFILWILVGNFFALNVFLAAIIDVYDDMRRSLDGSMFLTEKQQKQQDLAKIALKAKPKREQPLPKHPVRRKLWIIVHTSLFTNFIMACIFGNVIVLAMEHWRMTDAWISFIDAGNLVFLIIFALEAALKLIAMYPYLYFKDHWNKFDFALVVIGVITLFLEAKVSGMRVLRLIRAFRLVQSLRQLMRTLLGVIPKAWNVAIVLFTFYYIFAIMGMALMGNLADGDAFGDDANFRNFPKSLDLLFRLSTGDDFTSIMYDSMDPELEGCNPDIEGNCGYGPMALYHVAFLIVSVFVLLNLFVGIILDSFGSAEELDAKALHLDDWERFGKLWKKLDPEDTDTLSAKKAMVLLNALGPPLWPATQGVDLLGNRKEIVPNRLGTGSLVQDTMICLQAIDVRLTKENEVRYEWMLRGLTTLLARVDTQGADRVEVAGDDSVSEFSLQDWYVVDVLSKNFLRGRKKIGKKEMLLRMKAAEETRRRRLAGELIPTTKYKGVVKWFNDAKGFGAISRSDNQEIFVHGSAIEVGVKSLEVGQPVEFEVVIVHQDDETQLHARNVQLKRKRTVNPRHSKLGKSASRKSKGI